MLEANKSNLFERIFAVYNRNLFKRRFNSLGVSGLEFLSRKNSQIVYANHSSWWDGLVAFEISRKIKADSFIMMEEKQLRKLFLFRKLGAFSIVRENPRQAVKSLEYATNLLKEKPNRTIWIFPQGEILPNDARPIRFYHGAARIVEKAKNCSAIPLAIRYEFRGEFKPEIYVKIGEPETFDDAENLDAKSLTRNFERRLTETLDELKLDISSREISAYEKIF